MRKLSQKILAYLYNMIPSNYTAKLSETKKYAVVPDGLYTIKMEKIELKTGLDKKTGEPQDTFSITYNIEEGSYKGQKVWANWIPSYLYISNKTGKNKLYQVVESALSRELTQIEIMQGLSGDFLNGLIGTTVNAMIVVVSKNGKDFNNIIKWIPLNVPKMQPIKDVTLEELAENGVIEDTESIPF